MNLSFFKRMFVNKILFYQSEDERRLVILDKFSFIF